MAPALSTLSFSAPPLRTLRIFPLPIAGVLSRTTPTELPEEPGDLPVTVAVAFASATTDFAGAFASTVGAGRVPPMLEP
jgi:hypothetical protein